MSHDKQRLHKKHKKSNKCSSSSDSDYEWTEQKQVRRPVTKEVPEDFTGADKSPSIEGFLESVTSAPKKDKRLDQVETHKRTPHELNPYWKDGGAGLPEPLNPYRAKEQKSILTESNESWLRMSFRRCLEQAKTDRVAVEDALLQRWNRATVDDMLRRFGHEKTGSHSRYALPRHRSRSPAQERSKSPHPRWRKLKSTDDEDSLRSVDHDVPASRSPITAHGDRSCERLSKDTRHDSIGSHSSSVRSTETEERVVTTEDINSMAAKVLKAELGPDSTKAAKLKANLEKLRDAQRRGVKVRMHVIPKSAQSTEADKPSVVALTRLNDRGMEMPVYIPSQGTMDGSSKRSKYFSSHNTSGQRTAYFPDDTSGRSLEDLIQEEQLRSSGDVEYEFAQLASKSGKNVDDEYDDAFVPHRSHAERDARRLKQDAIAAYKRRAVAESSCMVCLERVPKHLVISVGEKVFLSLPGHLSVVSGHCLLTPYEHIGSTTRLDDCTIRELSAFKRQLAEMCKKQLNGSGCVFIENAVRIDSPRSHIQVDCIPVDGDVFDSLPAYFQKALSEIGSEWDQNRRVIRLKPGGMGAHGAVPPKLPYFAVEFGLLGGGLVRVIDDGRDIPSYFGREIIGEVLGKNTHFWRKPKPESFERLCEKVVQFEAWWTPFDNWSQRDPRGRSSAESRRDSVPPNPLIPEGPELPPSLPS